MKNGKRAWLLALIILLSLVVLWRRVFVHRYIPLIEHSGRNENNKGPGKEKYGDDRSDKSPESSNERSTLSRDVSRIIYTRHAKCRMDCRNIDSTEVNEILLTGEVNYQKSDLRSSPDPKYALEGNTHDGQHVRIIFANSSRGPVVVTVIDLEKEWYCDCK
jgi:hypothetical protein